MSSEIKSGAEATQIAQSVLEKGYGFIRPVKAQQIGDIWYVEIDVGVFKPRIAKFKIDAKTGVVVSYEVSPEAS